MASPETVTEVYKRWISGHSMNLQDVLSLLLLISGDTVPKATAGTHLFQVSGLTVYELARGCRFKCRGSFLLSW